jgi:hypothetical protein
MFTPHCHEQAARSRKAPKGTPEPKKTFQIEKSASPGNPLIQSGLFEFKKV